MLKMNRVIVFILVLTLAACEESSPAKESAPQVNASPDPVTTDTSDNSPSESETDRSLVHRPVTGEGCILLVDDHRQIENGGVLERAAHQCGQAAAQAGVLHRQADRHH